jgi:hypothetical protein
MRLGCESSRGTIVVPTLVFEKVFIYMGILALYAHVVSTSTWHLTHRLVNVS